MQELELTEKMLKEIEYIEKLQEAEEFDVEKFTGQGGGIYTLFCC